MRIAITGAHRVGKTTLAEKLQIALPGYTYVQEPYYHLEERGHAFSNMPCADDFVVQLEHSLKRMHANTLLSEMITDFNVPVLEVTGSVAQREQQVLKYIREQTARP